MNIVTLTMNPTIDLHVTVDRLEPGDKLRGRGVRRDPGGGGVNVARVIRVLQRDALALYPAGGPVGTLLQEMLAEEGVESKVQEITEMTRENFTVEEADTNRQYRFVLPGPELEEEEWLSCLDLVSGLDPLPEYLVASGSLAPGAPADFYGRLAAWARKAEVRMVLDTSGEPLQAALKEGVYLVKPNRRELGNLVGRELTTIEEGEEICRDLVEQGKAEVVALTLGDKGGLLVSADGSRRIEVPDVEVQSSVGAGDSFLAAMIVGLVEQWSLQKAFCYGIAAGTAALLTPGTELCRKEEVERLHGKICRDYPED